GVVVGRRGVEIARLRQRVFGVDARYREGRRRDDADRQPKTRVPGHFFLMSTLSRVGESRVTVEVYFRSPRSGCLNTTSCVPMASATLPMGVSPTWSPSTHTSAHGCAFSAIDPFGISSLMFAT